MVNNLKILHSSRSKVLIFSRNPMPVQHIGHRIQVLETIDSSNNYLGGAISPGIRLRYESLHQYTANLPLLIKSYPESIIGNSTQESIHSGVINGVVLEIDGFIEQYKTEYPNFIIILTGGDADFLAKRLKNTIFANSNFLLESLIQTFQYNQK